MTTVSGRLVRSVGPNSFQDITEARVVSISGGVTFDGDLTPEQHDAVWWRITSADDADQAKRENIADLRAAAAAPASTADDVKALTIALADYLLGT